MSYDTAILSWADRVDAENALRAAQNTDPAAAICGAAPGPNGGILSVDDSAATAWGVVCSDGENTYALCPAGVTPAGYAGVPCDRPAPAGYGWLAI